MKNLFLFATQAVLSQKLRSLLTVLGISIGIASITLLTAIGEGVRDYMSAQFTQFGTNLLGVKPGKTETWGVMTFVSNSPRPLSLDDARRLKRVPGVQHVNPVTVGMASVEYESRSRDVYIYGTTSAGPAVYKMDVRFGRFIPETDWESGAPVCVLGPTVKTELFGHRNALGEKVRIGNNRFHVIGVMEPKGKVLGYDIDDSVYIPIARGMSLFNRFQLDTIDISLTNTENVDNVSESIRQILLERHSGNEDFTIITQTDMLNVLDKIMNIVRSAVAGIAGISLFVGAIGVLTIMWICVSERRSEIGLMKAIGASNGQILFQFLTEACLLALIGGIFGLILGLGGAECIHLILPQIPILVDPVMVVSGLLISFLVGLISGILPARKAIALDPIDALRAE